MIWYALALLALIALFAFPAPNQIGGAMTIGSLLGGIAALIYWLLGYGFAWTIIAKWAVVLMLIAGVSEIFHRARRRS